MIDEASIVFGEGGGLVGTITRPPAKSMGQSDTAFIFFNAGVVHRIGVHRSNVKVARQLAARGISSLRFDLAGVGDSGRASGQIPFAEQAVSDICAAMDALHLQAGVNKFVLFGTCSGTVHSYAAALADQRIVGLAMFDTYLYPTLKSRINFFILRLNRHRTEGSLVKRAFTLGKRALKKIVSRLGAQNAPSGVSGEKREIRNVGFFAFRPAKAEFAAGLSALLERNVKVLLIYAGSGFAHYNYSAQFSDAFSAFDIAKRVDTVFLKDADHTATRLAAQADLVAAVDHWAAQFAICVPHKYPAI
jgi:pimeloyl-ACP methyl ester carboxylesterase